MVKFSQIDSKKLKVVLAHNFLGPYGGAEQSLYKIYQMLKSRGHEVFFFGTDFQPFFEEKMPYATFFPRYTDYDNIKTTASVTKNLKKPFWNSEAKKKFDQFLSVVQPDIIHYGSVHWHLSPSVIQSALDFSIPTVMTLREARQICPAGTLLKSGESYCDELLCVKGGCHNVIKHKCYDKSLVKSLFVAAEFKFRKLHQLFSKVNQLISPSYALLDLVAMSGEPSKKLNFVPNFLDNVWLNQLAKPSGERKYFFYAGRLSAEKGIKYLIDALSQLPEKRPLKIAGHGEALNHLKEQVDALGLQNWVTFVGQLNEKELQKAYSEAIATIVPSIWFENFGRTLIEAMACGSPVIASNLGGMKEIIQDQVTGFLVPPKNSEAIAEAMQRFIQYPDLIEKFASTGMQSVNNIYSEEIAYKEHIAVYRKALSV
ncbi:MAG: glycosyltransferase family 4 protein [Cyanobacteria bacterium P01_H01_bin.74]